MTIDQKGFHELIEESQDIHADAMREVKPVLADLADLRSDRLRGLAPTPILDIDAPQKSRFSISRLLGAGAFGAALAALVSRPANAAEPLYDRTVLRVRLGLHGAAERLRHGLEGSHVLVMLLHRRFCERLHYRVAVLDERQRPRCAVGGPGQNLK